MTDNHADSERGKVVIAVGLFGRKNAAPSDPAKRQRGTGAAPALFGRKNAEAA